MQGALQSVEMGTMLDWKQDFRYDPTAGRGFELLTGAYIWDDELPDDREKRLLAMYYLRPVWAYRTSLTLGEPRLEFQEQWERAREELPTWPGFREERIHGELLAAELLADLEAESGGFTDAIGEVIRGLGSD